MKTLEERREQFNLMWGIAPKGSLKYKKREELWQWFKLQMEEEHIGESNNMIKEPKLVEKEHREQVLHMSYNKKNTLRLAKFMHEEYENMARLQDWETQEKCRVSFEALPEKNIKTMLGVAQQILKNFLPTLKNSKEDREEIMMGVSHEAGFVGLGGMFVNSPISKLEIKTGKVTEPTSYELGKLIYQEIKFTLKNSKEEK